jgi:hypothetical protein
MYKRRLRHEPAPRPAGPQPRRQIAGKIDAYASLTRLRQDNPGLAEQLERLGRALGALPDIEGLELDREAPGNWWRRE